MREYNLESEADAADFAHVWVYPRVDAAAWCGEHVPAGKVLPSPLRDAQAVNSFNIMPVPSDLSTRARKAVRRMAEKCGASALADLPDPRADPDSWIDIKHCGFSTVAELKAWFHKHRPASMAPPPPAGDDAPRESDHG